MSKKLAVVYDPLEGHTVPDGAVDRWAETICEWFNNDTEDMKIIIGSSHMFDALRIQIIRGVLKHDEVEAHFDNEVITINAHGRPSAWPKGFCDHSLIRLRELAAGKKL